jgi:hypothetical protein
MGVVYPIGVWSGKDSEGKGIGWIEGRRRGLLRWFVTIQCMGPAFCHSEADGALVSRFSSGEVLSSGMTLDDSFHDRDGRCSVSLFHVSCRARFHLWHGP